MKSRPHDEAMATQLIDQNQYRLACEMHLGTATQRLAFTG